MSGLPDYLFIADTGELYDTRLPHWSNGPLRQRYSVHCRSIDTVADLKATLRAGQYAWPGGYPLHFVTSDGAALSFDAVRQEFRQVAYAIRHRLDDGWQVVACYVNWEDSELYCDHTGIRIESAYGDDEEG